MDDPYKLAGGPTPPLSYISKSPMEATADIHILGCLAFSWYACLSGSLPASLYASTSFFRNDVQRCVYLSDKISGCSLCMFARGVHSWSPGSRWGQYEHAWHRMKWLMIRSFENHIQQPLPVLDSLSVCALVCMSQGACFGACLSSMLVFPAGSTI